MEKDVKILIIEDDEILNAGLCYHIQNARMLPVSAYRLEEAGKRLEQENFDLILLDVNLPDGNGFAFAEELAGSCRIPFLFLTAHNLEEEIIRGLRLGADGYIVKPFSVRVLMEKIQTVLRRCSGTKRAEPCRYGNLTIDLENRLVKRKTETISLTPTEFELLAVFCKSGGRILTKEILLERIWDVRENYVNEHTLALNVSRLRNKIADEEYEYIKTIYGLGYKWIGEKG